jgi:hypothetical protein
LYIFQSISTLAMENDKAKPTTRTTLIGANAEKDLKTI